MTLKPALVPFALCLLSTVVDADVSLITKITGDSPDFGHNLRLANGRLLAIWEQSSPPSPNSALLFDAVSGELVREYVHDIIGTPSNDTISFDGDSIVVAGQTRKGLATTGKVRLYSPIDAAPLLIEDSVASTGFGWSVGVFGDRMVVGTPLGTASGQSNSGIATLYEVPSGAFITNLAESLPRPAGGFGLEVEMNDQWLAIESISNRIWLFSPDNGDLLGTITLPSASPSTIAIDGDLLAVGDVNEDRVYLYDLAAAELVQTLQLPEGIDESLRFGFDVDLDAGLVVVGAPLFLTEVTPYAFVFTTAGALVDQLTPTGPDEDFGRSVAIDDGLIGVGAISRGSGDGAVYIYAIPEPAFGLLTYLVWTALMRHVVNSPSDRQRVSR